MVKNSSLTQQELTNLLSDIVFKQKSFTELAYQKIKQNSNLTQSIIMASLVPKIRNLLIDIEKHLFIAKKIFTLTVYDNGQDFYFEGVIKNLNEIVPQNCRNEFMELYKNSMQTSLDIIWQKHYTYVQSDKRMQIYTSLLQFSESHCLFIPVRQVQYNQLVTGEELQIQMNDRPYMDISRLFPIRDLQLILHCFRLTQCHAIKTHRLLLQKGMIGENYTNQVQFITRLDNILLIGAYSLYEKYCQKKNRPAENWVYFKRKAWKHVDFTQYLLVLMRVAIRNDATSKQIDQIQKIFNMKQFHEMNFETIQQQNVKQNINNKDKSKKKQNSKTKKAFYQ